MKKVLLLSALALVSTNTFANCSNGWIVTSHPNMDKVEVIKMDAFTYSIPKVIKEDGKYKSISMPIAYSKFYKHAHDIVAKACKKNKYDWAANFDVKFAATEDRYEFLGTLDYYKNK